MHENDFHNWRWDENFMVKINLPYRVRLMQDVYMYFVRKKSKSLENFVMESTQESNSQFHLWELIFIHDNTMKIDWNDWLLNYIKRCRRLISTGRCCNVSVGCEEHDYKLVSWVMHIMSSSFGLSNLHQLHSAIRWLNII